MGVEFGLLGPIQVRVQGRPRTVGGPRQRAVLAALLLSANRVVRTNRLLEMVWPEIPVSASSNLRTYLARLRRVVHVPGEDRSRLCTGEGGYLLAVHPGELDLATFEENATEGESAQDADTVCEYLSRALEAWRGDPLEDVPLGQSLAAEVTRLLERRNAVRERWLEARLALGQHAELLPELSAFVVDNPLRERAVAALMRALHAAQRRGEALEVYRQTRRRFVDELGVEPGAELRELHQWLLCADADPPSVRPAPTRTVAVSTAESGYSDGKDGTGTVDGGAAGIHRQLPADIAEFTGRGHTLASILALARRSPRLAPTICVVHGMGGVGKTRLVVRAAHQLVAEGRFGDGQLFVDLRGYTAGQTCARPADVLAAFLQGLGVPGERIPADPQARATMFRDRLAGKRMLILLDNAAGEEQLAPLLPASPGCTVLVTSRRNLALEGSVSIPLDVFSEPEALELLGVVAGRSRVVADPHAAEELVRRCGHLPIAVALAAHRLRARSAWKLTDLLARLRDHDRLLTELSAGNRAVRGVLDLSYLALGSDQRRLLRLLGIHPGEDVTPESAGALLGTGAEHAEELLEELVDENLLQQPTPRRYRTHDLVRAYARDRVDTDEPAGDRDAAVQRVLAWYLQVVITARVVLNPHSRRALPSVPSPRCGDRRPTRSTVLAQCDAERANLVAAVHVAAERGEASLAWQLCSGLLSYFYLTKHWDDWISTHRAALLAAQEAGDVTGQAYLYNGLGVAYSDLRRYEEAIRCHRAAATLFRAVADRHGLAWNMNNLGVTYDYLHRFPEALDCYARALDLFQEIGDAQGEGLSLNNLGDVHRQRGSLGEAECCLRQALRVQDLAGDRDAQRFTRTTLGDLHRDAGGSDEQAVAHYESALVISREVGDRQRVAQLLLRIAALQEVAGRHRVARDHMARALVILAELGDPAANEVRARLGRAPDTGAGWSELAARLDNRQVVP